jgi:DNA invertase Pin-like site-specific DNA recombinase
MNDPCDRLPRRRVVLLGRVSRGERQQDPESQLAPLRAAGERLCWTIAAEVSLALSAWDAAAAAEVRRRALAPIEAGQADTLAVWSYDRYMREGIEGAFRELRYLEDHLGAAFYSLQEPFLSTATADKAQRELLLSLVAWTARWESQHKSDRLCAKVASKRARAAALGARAVWGAGHLASDADVERIRALRATGLSMRKIAEAVGLSKSQVGRILDPDR